MTIALLILCLSVCCTWSVSLSLKDLKNSERLLVVTSTPSSFSCSKLDTYLKKSNCVTRSVNCTQGSKLAMIWAHDCVLDNFASQLLLFAYGAVPDENYSPLQWSFSSLNLVESFSASATFAPPGVTCTSRYSRCS